MRKIAAFVRLSRPQFLVGGFAGFALGAAVAAYEGARITPLFYAAGQTMVTAFQLMTHYTNEYYDRAGDRRGRPSAFSGGSGVLVAGGLAPRTALIAGLSCAGIGALAVIALAHAGMLVAAGIGAAIGLCAWWYSVPPVRLAERGWGEIDTALVVAVFVPLAGYSLFAGSVDELAIAATFAPAFAMFAMMIAVEWPDREADTACAKRNLIVRFGSTAAGRLSAGGALLIVPAFFVAIAGGAPWAGAAFSLLLVPPIAGFVRRIGAPYVSATEVAARGVTVFLLTVTFAVFGYVTVLR
jgi:1,4-dihydroxy-2-naphthoate octaprenyltransferase